MSTAPSFRDRDRDRDRLQAHHAQIAKLFDKLPPHAIETECALLGAMILDSQVIGEVVQILKGPDDFYKTAHGAIYQVLVELYDQTQQIDMVQVNQRLRDLGKLEEIGGTEYLVQLAESVPSAVTAPHYARIVREKSQLRHLIDAAGKVLYDAYHSGETVANQLDQAEQAIFRLAEGRTSDDVAHLSVLLQETYDKLDAQARDGKTITGLETGFIELDDITNGLQNGEMIIVAARPSMGKAQPLDAKVLTTTGWTTMGQLRVGDALASVDGQLSTVLGIFPQGQRQVFRVTFADGRSTECCDEHLWQVHYRSWDRPRVLSTAKLRQLLARQRYVNRLWIEPFSGEFGVDDALPLDPWLLGCLLGDGSLSGSSVRFSTSDDEMLQRVRLTAGQAITVTAAGGYDYRLTQTGGAHRAGIAGVSPNPVKSALQDLQLWGCDAKSKFIPACYKTASRASRVRLLAGLMDTDGWVEKWGSMRLATCSEQLARDVVELIRSLGGCGSYTRKCTTYSYRGAKLAGQPAFVCNLQHADATQFIDLSHKKARLAPGRQRQRRLNLVSIEPTRTAATQCIAVSHPTHLYVTDDFIVTHNTAFALNIAEFVGATRKQPVAIFSLEMSKQQLAQRLLCARSGVDSHKLRRNMLSSDDFALLHETCGELSDAPIFIDDTPGLSLMALRAKARRLATRHDIKAVMIDYLQLMSCPGSESRQQEVSELSRGVKGLARELSVPVICLSQLNRAAEGREGHRPRMSDLRESGSIEQDADVIMMLHREDYYHQGEDGYEPTNVAEVIIAKQRNGPTGTVKLHFAGSSTRFNNLATTSAPAY
jgi:replicative DNA helicase